MMKIICGVLMLLVIGGCGSTGPDTQMSWEEASWLFSSFLSTAANADHGMLSTALLEADLTSTPRTVPWDSVTSCSMDYSVFPVEQRYRVVSLIGQVSVSTAAALVSATASGTISLDQCVYSMSTDRFGGYEVITLSNPRPLNMTVFYEETLVENDIRVLHRTISIDGPLAWSIDDGRKGRCNIKIDSEVFFSGRFVYTWEICGQRGVYPES
ncbi:MAG: hypothetical protein LBG44_04480 [Gemmatimonadota bacterium]|nr:hypothetical protein [Gemmatimonadota bacterium]